MPGGCSVYRFGPFALDAPRGRVFCGAKRVPLRDSQFAILLQLVSHAGDIVTKDDLVNAAWRTAVSDNSLDQAISRLRKILGRDSNGMGYIETVPNRGYRFTARVERAQRLDPDASSDPQLAPFRTLVRGQADLDTLDRDAVLRLVDEHLTGRQNRRLLIWSLIYLENLLEVFNCQPNSNNHAAWTSSSSKSHQTFVT